MTNIIAIENCHLSWVYPLNMMIFHSYVSLPEGIWRPFTGFSRLSQQGSTRAMPIFPVRCWGVTPMLCQKRPSGAYLPQGSLDPSSQAPGLWSCGFMISCGYKNRVKSGTILQLEGGRPYFPGCRSTHVSDPHYIPSPFQKIKRPVSLQASENEPGSDMGVSENKVPPNFVAGKWFNSVILLIQIVYCG